jgi:hypothetical protein
MKYLLDADVFIRSKNDFYAFDTHPGFWRWLEQEHQAGNLFSVQRIKRELTEERDQLSQWADINGTFFLPHDAKTRRSMGIVAAWAQSSRWEDSVKNDFLKSGELELIAHAHAYLGEFEIVTFERDQPECNSVIKCPVAARANGVEAITLFKLIARLKPRFVLGGEPPPK